MRTFKACYNFSLFPTFVSCDILVFSFNSALWGLYTLLFPDNMIIKTAT
jgi:hypothetical protein